MARVLIISPNPANRAGGVERSCVLLKEALETRGWEAEIVGPPRPPTVWEFRLGLGYPMMSWTATNAARAAKPDAIVSNGYLGYGSIRGVPRVHVYHGTLPGATRATADALPRREVLRRSLSGGLTEAIAGRGAKVVCVSNATAKEVRRCYRVSTDAVIPNAIDTSVFAPRSQQDARGRMGLEQDRRYALFVGRLEHGKGAEVTIEAARRAGYELMVAGAAGTADVKRLGILGPDQLADAYAAADCVVLASHYEACSLVVLEALACGRALLSTPVGWMESFLEVLPAYRTLCVEPEVEDIASRLQMLERIDTGELTTAARAFVVQHNSLSEYGAQWHSLLESVLA